LNELFFIWLSLSLSGSLIALVLIALRPVLLKFGKTWQYYIWLVVLLRLLIPYSADASVIGGLFQQTGTYFTTQPSDIKYPLNINVSDYTENLNNSKSVNDTAQMSETSTVNAFTVKSNFLNGLWLAVAMILFFRKIYGYQQFIKTIKRDCKIVEDNQLLSVLQTVCKAMGIKKKIVVCTNQLLMAPTLIGIIRPVVLLPTENICSADLDYIFRHELIHYRRRDFLYKWLTEITVCLHWFNPLVYWVRRIINQDCEFSCDERMIRQLNTRERQAYGETLLDSINPNRLIVKNNISLSLNEDGKLIKERLNAIMNYQRKSKFIVFTATVFTAILSCCTVYAGAYAAPFTKTATLNETVKPIQISVNELNPSGKISLGAQSLSTGTVCNVSLTWSGDKNLWAICESGTETQKEYAITNGNRTSFIIEKDGSYKVAIRNCSPNTLYDVKGSISFSTAENNKKSTSVASPDAKTADNQSVVYENVTIYHPSSEEDAYPYIHNIRTNNTTKTIVKTEVGMLAYDKKGKPLKINWYSTDSNGVPSFDYLFDWNATKIIPGQTDNVTGGWTLNISGTDQNVEKIAYLLYCDKKITFSDGTVWENPYYDTWLKNYRGKKVSVKLLNNYYPYVQVIE